MDLPEKMGDLFFWSFKVFTIKEISSEIDLLAEMDLNPTDLADSGDLQIFKMGLKISHDKTKNKHKTKNPTH